MNATIIESLKAPVFRAFGEEIHFLLTAPQTDGKFTSFINITQPGGGPPPHYHEAEDEWFYILEGRMSFLLDGAWREAAPGDTVFAPRKSVHAFKNTGTTPSRMLVHTSPSGFEDFFAAAAAEFAKPGEPDMARAMQIAAQYGIHFVAP